MRRAKKKKGIEGQRTKPVAPTQAMNSLIRDEERIKREKQG